MKARTSYLATLFIISTNLSVFLPMQAQAAEGNVQAMAGMVAGINHYPDDAQKATLKKIADDASAPQAERTLAGALLRMQHSVADDDKQKLKTLMDDKAASESARKLAGVLMRFQHKASAEDKETLKSIAK